MRRVDRNHLAGDQPIEQHADTGEMLLDRRSRYTSAELLYISGDMDGLDFIERANPLRFRSLLRTRRVGSVELR
jgi:hypothetical protein